MERMWRVLVSLVVVVYLSGIPLARAQENEATQCPASFSCVPFEGQTIAVNPEYGAYQVLVIEERTTNVVSLFVEETTEVEVIGLGLEQQEDGSFKVDRTYSSDDYSFLVGASVEDVFALEKVD